MIYSIQETTGKVFGQWEARTEESPEVVAEYIRRELDPATIGYNGIRGYYARLRSDSPTETPWVVVDLAPDLDQPTRDHNIALVHAVIGSLAITDPGEDDEWH